jgi:hypothetical protein
MHVSSGEGGGDDKCLAVQRKWRRVRAAVVVVVTIAIFATWIGLRVGGSTSVVDFDDVVTFLAALAAASFCLRAGLDRGATARRFWLLLAAACGAWTLAEAIWAVYDIVLRVAVPIPSWADVGYLSAIPLVVAALLSHPAMSVGRKWRGRSAFDGILLATALFFLSWSFVLGPLWRHTDLTSLGGVVAVAYPFGDVIMVFLVVGVIRDMASGDRFAMGCVLGGLVAMAGADSTYTYLTEVGRYATGNMIDTGWVIGYLGLALGAFCSSGAERTEAARVAAPAGLRSLVVNFLPTLLALSVLTIEMAVGRKLYRSDWFIAMALVVLSLARQFLMLLEQVGPLRPTRPGAAEEVPG